LGYRVVQVVDVVEGLPHPIHPHRLGEGVYEQELF
jgi:hypothetical protein